MITISLKLDGYLKDDGFRVYLEIQSDQYCIEKLGTLSANPELERQLTQHWQSYRKIYAPYRGGIKPLEIDAGTRQFDCQASAKQLSDRFNQWLNSSSFQTIDRVIREQLSENQLHQLIIQTQDNQLLKLPWEKWDLFNETQQMIVKFVPLESKSERDLENPKIKKVLAILGHKEGINLKQDRHSLEQWTKQQICFLDEPSLQRLNDYLWKESWDLIFFAGHSETKEDQGRIYLNSQESLTVDQLENALKEATKKGLKVAIFNSCDGIGLAKQLESLSIPHIIVMRELIPDQVAHHFLIYFLENFTQGQSFEISVQKAQRRLQGLEPKFPCATWLPLIYQKPNTLPPIWERITPYWKEWGKVAGKSALVTGLVMGLRWIGPFQGLELMAYDTLMQQRAAESRDPRIAVVEITDDDISRYGYPLPDAILEEALVKLNQHNPRVIGVDIHRSKAETKERQDLINFLSENTQIVPVCYSNDISQFEPHPDLPIEQYGFSDLPLDPGKKVRRQLVSYDPDLAENQSLCATPYSLSLQLSYRYLQAENIAPLIVNEQDLWQFGEVTFPKLPAKFGGYQTLSAGKTYEIMINYRSEASVGQKISLSDLLDGEVTPSAVEDKIILLGYTSSDAARDNYETPIGILPGVWIHANMTSQMVSAVIDGRSLIQAFPQWGDALLIFVGSVGTGILIWSLKTYSPKYAIWGSMISISILSLILYQICRISLSNGLWLPWLPIQLAFLLIVGVMLIHHKRLGDF